MRRGWIDRVLVGAALLLVAGVAVQGIASWLGGRDEPKRPVTGLALVTVVPVEPDVTFTIERVDGDGPPAGEGLRGDVPLRNSPETQFLPVCSFQRLRYEVEPGPALRLRYEGPPCRPPAVRLEAVVRDPQGATVRRVPALDATGATLLGAHLAGSADLSASLAEGLLRCRSGRPDGLRAADHGTVVRGTVPCRAQR